MERNKASVRKETVAVSSTKPKIVRKKPEHTAATLCEPALSRGRGVSKKRSIRGKSNHGAILSQPCRYYLKGTCTRTSCEYWHPPECQFKKMKLVVRLETSVCFRITRLMNNQIKGRRKATSQKEEKVKTRERCGHCEKRITMVLCVTRLRCTRLSRNERVSGRPDAKKS